MNEEKLQHAEIDNVQVDGIDSSDYPDFCDAYISSADYKGEPMTEEQLDLLNENRDYVYNRVIEKLF